MIFTPSDYDIKWLKQLNVIANTPERSLTEQRRECLISAIQCDWDDATVAHWAWVVLRDQRSFWGVVFLAAKRELRQRWGA